MNYRRIRCIAPLLLLAGLQGQTTFPTSEGASRSPAAAHITAAAGTPQSAAIDTQFATQLQAAVTDSGSNPVPGVTVTFTAPSRDASGTFTDTEMLPLNNSGDSTDICFDGENMWVTDQYYGRLTKVLASTFEVLETVALPFVPTGGDVTGCVYDATTKTVWGVQSDNAALLGSVVKVLTGTGIGSAVPSGGSGGIGYVVNDVVTVVQPGASGGTLRITSIGPGGVVTGLSVATAGDGYGGPLGTAAALPTTGGTGTGLEADTSVIVGMYSTVAGGYSTNGTSDGVRIWTSDDYSGTVTAFVAATGAVHGTYATGGLYPNGIAYCKGAIWVTNSNVGNSGPGTVSAISASAPAASVATSPTSLTIGTGSMTLTTQSGLGFHAGQFIQILDSANFLNFMTGAITSYRGGMLAVDITAVSGSGTFAAWQINAAGPSVLHTVTVGANPIGVACGGAVVYVNNSDATLTVLDSKTGAVVAVYNTGFIYGGYIDVDGSYLWLPNYVGNDVLQMEASTGVIVASYPAGSGPAGVVVDGMGNVFVADYNSGSLYKLRPAPVGAPARAYMTTAVTDASGIATAPAFTANGIAGGYGVLASVEGVAAKAVFSLGNTSTPAVVANVTSETANGSYTVGATISVTVTFSKPVNVTGTPRILLNSGGTASYASGSGTSTLTFLYAVAAGQNSPHLDAASSGALRPNGGRIQDASTAAATLTLPNPGAAGSLGANTNIVIDTH